jgi:hypothetical protein
MLYIYLFVGVVLHFIMKFRNAYTEKSNFDWQRNIILTFFTLPMGIVLVYFNTEILSGFDCVLIGYTLDSTIKNIEGFSWRKLGK